MLQVPRTALIVLVCFGLCSCAPLLQLAGLSNATSDDVTAAAKANDWDTLDKLCSGQRRADHYAQQDACHLVKGHKLEQTIATESCPDLLAHYEEEAHGVSDQRNDALTDKLGLRHAQCGHWDVVFEKLVHWGQEGEDNSGYRLLVNIAKAGLDPGQELLRYLARSQKPLSFEHAEYAANHLGHWLEHNDKPQYCEALAHKVGDMPEGVQTVLMSYFRKSKCRPALPAAVALLASDLAGTRLAACDVLGEIGNPSVVPKLMVVANHDGYWNESDGFKQYPVRDACSQAASKLTLRAGN